MPVSRSFAIALSTASLLALSACGERTIEATDESAESVARKVADAEIRLQPGRWESTMKMDSMEIGGVPPEARAAMKQQANSVHTFSTCLTPQDVEKPDAEFFQKGAAGCTYDTFTMGGGKIQAAMTCKSGNGSMKTTMQGTYAADSYQMAIQSSGEMQKGMPMKMAMTITSRRTGDCTGREE
ncbi:MAG: DUF3617 domain-containing protein [Novosphingobium sp.]|nr:DUF3617 domain-containing protein [Novosphingobium sp.]